MNAPLTPPLVQGVESVEQPEMFQFCRIDMPGGQQLTVDDFRLVSFQGQENASDLFEYHLELHGDTDGARPAIDLNQIVGRPVLVAVACGAFDDEKVARKAFRRVLDGSEEEGPFSLFHGIVAAFGFDIPGVYRLTMRPAAWRMTHTNRYRIHRHMSVREVLEELCRLNDVSASFEDLKGKDNLASSRIQDWLQAGESDFELLRRLLGKAHIHFYFRHAIDGHTMVFSNRARYPDACPGDAPLRYTYTAEDELGWHQADLVTQYSFQRNLGSSGTRTTFTLLHEAWDVKQPGQPLAHTSNFLPEANADAGALPFNQYKIVQYGFRDNAVRQEYERATDLALQTANLQLSGASRCAHLRVGHRFRMVALHPTDVRPELEGLGFVVTQIQHTASLDGDYQNEFTAAPDQGLISPMSVQDTQQGVLLATVCAANGDTSIKDWPYYVPDDFSMSRETQEDRNGGGIDAKGVFVRLCTDDPKTAAPLWVKLAAHMQTVPEVGCTVWITRAGDESELPEIQNIVQGDGTKTITNSEWTAHSQVGNSFSANYGDSRGIHFGQKWSRADVDAAVELVEKAYARKVFRDAGYSRGASYSYQTSEDKEQGLLGESWSYGSSYSYGWAKESKSFNATGRTYQENITGKSDTSLSSSESDDPRLGAAVQASKGEVYGDSINLSTHHGDVTAETTITGTHDNKSLTAISKNLQTTGISNSISTTGASDATELVGVSNSTQLIGAHTVTAAIGLSINNAATGISIANSATGSSTANELVGTSTRNATTGTSTQSNTVGTSHESSVTGVSTQTQVQGVVASAQVVGEHTGVTVTGNANNVSVTGLSSAIEIVGAGARMEITGAMFRLSISGPTIEIPVIVMVM